MFAQKKRKKKERKLMYKNVLLHLYLKHTTSKRCYFRFEHLHKYITHMSGTKQHKLIY